MGELVVRDVTVFTGRGELLERAGVVVSAGRISAVGEQAAPPRGAEVVEGEGRFLMAGFIDAHTHLALLKVPERPEMHPDAPFMAVRNAAVKLASGVTTVRDVGGLLHLDLALRRAIRRGDVPGPRMLCAGQAICPTGGHIHYFAREADGPDEVRKAAREQFRAGADFIKVMVSGGIANVGEDPDQLHMGADELSAAVVEAEARGTTVAAHVYPARGIRMAAECGVTSIEHAPGLDDDAIDILRDRRRWIVPTQAVYRWMGENRDGWLPEAKAEAARRVFDDKTPRLRRAIEAGIRVAVGTDCGRHFPHDDYVGELLQLQAVGMSTEQVLLAATRAGAELLGIADRVGTVETGKMADLVILDGDPLRDLAAAGRVHRIIQGGRLLDPRALLGRRAPAS